MQTSLNGLLFHFCLGYRFNSVFVSKSAASFSTRSQCFPISGETQQRDLIRELYFVTDLLHLPAVAVAKFQ